MIVAIFFGCIFQVRKTKKILLLIIRARITYLFPEEYFSDAVTLSNQK